MLISTDVGSPSGLKGSSSISLSPKGERRKFHLYEASYNRAFYKLPLRVGRGYRDSWDRDLIDFLQNTRCREDGEKSAWNFFLFARLSKEDVVFLSFLFFD